jgi:hypothetical protein
MLKLVQELDKVGVYDALDNKIRLRLRHGSSLPFRTFVLLTLPFCSQTVMF